MMAQSLTVQELLGAADAEEALARIVCYTGYAADFDRPRLVISDLEDERGFLSELEFYIDDEDVVTIEDQYQFARDKAGSILLEMIDLSGTGQLADNTTYPRLEVATELNRTKQYIDTVEIPADERDDQGTDTEGLPLWVIVGEWKVR
jgi:hypothetical protein